VVAGKWRGRRFNQSIVQAGDEDAELKESASGLGSGEGGIDVMRCDGLRVRVRTEETVTV
jgi:hypothetical protein